MCKDGSILWVSDIGEKAEYPDGQEAIYCFISDITERKQKQMEMDAVNQEVRRQADRRHAGLDQCSYGKAGECGRN